MKVATIEALLDAREKLSYILPGIAIHNGSKSIMKKKNRISNPLYFLYIFSILSHGTHEFAIKIL
jgi:hypothetical protein